MIAHVLAWVPRAKERQPFRFTVDHTVGSTKQTIAIELVWDESKLVSLVPGLREKVARLLTGRTADREHITEMAAYGLAFVAISALMPGRRVQHMQMGLAPDILFDVTPNALRGVEVAGRTSGGRAALLTVRNGTKATARTPAKKGKAKQLRSRKDIVEVHLSLWSASHRLGILEQLKP